MKKIKVLIVDDEIEMLESYKKLFKKKKEFELTLSSKYSEALKLIKANDYNIFLADFKLADGNGIDLIKEAVKHIPDIKPIMITGYGTIEASVDAFQAGAVDFIEKPFNSKLLFKKIEEVIDKELNEEKNYKINNFYDIIYKSKEIDEIINTIKKIALSEITVLIQGESGTGKELIARAIHKLSLRKGEAFVPINCSALPENLFESELFGYEKGAFTGAVNNRPGILEFANNGTFFFDEITETPIKVQAKLLRLLEEKKIRRIGGNKEIDLNIRIISATNRNLDEAVSNKILREDLYYRLSTFVISLPPLRERRDDIIPLFNHYMENICKKHGHKTKKLSPNSENLLLNYNWPGNIRELINLTNKIFFICNKTTITEDDIPLPNSKKSNGIFNELKNLNFFDAKEKLVDSFEVEYLKHNLTKYEGNISKTAEMCGIDRRTIHRMIKKHGIIFK